MKYLIAGLSLLFAACTANATSKLGASEISVQAATIQLAQMEGNSVEVGLELDNHSQKTITLIAANSPIATQTLLHTTIDNGDKQAMLTIDRVLLKPTHLVTEPDNFHLMLINLKKILHRGDSVPVLLIFTDGSSLLVQANVV